MSFGEKLKEMEKSKYPHRVYTGSTAVYTLNKQKKYRLQEELNAEKQRQNVRLYQKLQEIKNRDAWRRVPIGLHADSRQGGSLSKKKKHKSKNKNNNLKIKTSESEILYNGYHDIDGVRFKTKIMLDSSNYQLLAKNQHTKIVLEIPTKQYNILHRGQLRMDPCNIFQYLQIQKGQLRFRSLQTENAVYKRANSRKKKKQNVHQKQFESHEVKFPNIGKHYFRNEEFSLDTSFEEQCHHKIRPLIRPTSKK